MRHARLYKILCIMFGEIPYRAAAAFTPRPRGTVALISATISAVSLWARRGLVMAWRTPRTVACSLFCRGVDHSKFSTLLFCLSPSLWFTQGRRGVAGKKAIATKRCTSLSDVDRYPFVVVFKRIGRGSPYSVLRTLPKSLTSWLAQFGHGFQVSTLQSPRSNWKWNDSMPLVGRQAYRN